MHPSQRILAVILIAMCTTLAVPSISIAKEKDKGESSSFQKFMQMFQTSADEPDEEEEADETASATAEDDDETAEVPADDTSSTEDDTTETPEPATETEDETATPAPTDTTSTNETPAPAETSPTNQTNVRRSPSSNYNNNRRPEPAEPVQPAPETVSPTQATSSPVITDPGPTPTDPTDPTGGTLEPVVTPEPAKPEPTPASRPAVERTASSPAAAVAKSLLIESGLQKFFGSNDGTTDYYGRVGFTPETTRILLAIASVSGALGIILATGVAEALAEVFARSPRRTIFGRKMRQASLK